MNSDILWFGLVAGGTLLLIVAAYGIDELYQQVVRYRLGSRQAEGWSLAANVGMLWGELRWDQPSFLGLTVVGGLLVAAARPASGWPVVAWAAATVAMLLVYSPLGIKHAALVPPPAAVLAGAGLGVAWSARGVVQRALAAGCAIGLLAYLWSLPVVLERDRLAMVEGDAGAEPPYAEESVVIRALTGPNDFILVDDPYLAFLNDRPVPPDLVDTSIFRIRSGSLSGVDVVSSAERFDVRLMLLLSDNLRELEEFAQWADDEFVVVKINERSNRKDRALYLRRDADFRAARAALRAAVGEPTPAHGEIAGQMRLASFAVDQTAPRAGSTINLTLEWESIAPIAVDWHVITFLRDASGEVVDQEERSLGGGSTGTSAWEPGRWVFRTATFRVPPRTPPGEYALGVGLYDSKAKRMATVTGGPGAGTDEVPLTRLRVR